jgi:hypothetical protein
MLPNPGRVHSNLSRSSSWVTAVWLLELGTSFIHSFIHSLMALQPFVGPWPLLQFRNHFTQTVGLLGRVIARPLPIHKTT